MPVITTPTPSSYLMARNIYDPTDVGEVATVQAFNWINLTGTPTCFVPCAHTHPISQIIGLSAALANTITNSNIVSTLSANYYTITQINNLLAGKANVVQPLDPRYVQVANFSTYYSGTGSEIDAALAAAEPLTHDHNNLYYTKAYIDNLFNQSNQSLSNDDRYHTQSQINGFLANKANVTHNHDNLYYKRAEVMQLFATAGVGSTWEYRAQSASSQWEINHNLGCFPSVTVVDSYGVVYQPQRVQYVDLNNITVTFSDAFLGTAYLNK